MERYKFVILGAGPSGLSFAHALQERGEKSFVVLEGAPEAGGLCRSAMVDGSPLDTGGGHFLDTRLRSVVDFLFRFMPESEWNRFKRISSISFASGEVDYPLEANIWQLPIGQQMEYLEAIARAGVTRGEAMPEGFRAWIHWKLGDAIARDYMIPYNEKIWSMDLDELGTYWLHKLPDVSFRDTLRSCLERRPHGILPAHGEFYYPRHFGYGEVWKRMGSALGDQLRCDCSVESIDAETRVVNGRYAGDCIVNTIPWPIWLQVARIPGSIAESIQRLVHVAIDVDYHAANLPSPAHWIYMPDPSLSHHRSLLRHNFIPGSRGHWTETNARRQRRKSEHSFSNPYAYPVNTRRKIDDMRQIEQWARGRGIIPLGRWGTWEHVNSDIAVERGLAAARTAVSS